MNLSPKLLEHANTLRSTVISTRIKCIQFRPTFEEKKIVKIEIGRASCRERV